MQNHPPYRENFRQDGMQSFLLKFESLFWREILFASKQTDIRVFQLVKCMSLTFRGRKTLIVKYLMTPLYFPVQFNGNLRFFLYLEFSLSRNNFAASCEFEIERIHSVLAKKLHLKCLTAYLICLGLLSSHLNIL